VVPCVQELGALRATHQQLLELREQDRQANVVLWELNNHLNNLLPPHMAAAQGKPGAAV